MNIECDDKFELEEFDLESLSLGELISMVNLLNGCRSCTGCDLEIALLLREIEARGGIRVRAEEDDDDD